MISSLWTGISGLDANGAAMGVIGNNIANVNTVGFKGSSMAFADILSQSLTGASGGNQIGRGVSLSAVQTQFLQGSFESTGSATDMAIDGSGFFVVKDASGGNRRNLPPKRSVFAATGYSVFSPYISNRSRLIRCLSWVSLPSV